MTWEKLIVYFGLDAGKEAGFITYARTGRIWFNTNQHAEPKQLSRCNSNALCHLREVQRIELNRSKQQLLKYLMQREPCPKDEMGHRSTVQPTLAYGQILVRS